MGKDRDALGLVLGLHAAWWEMCLVQSMVQDQAQSFEVYQSSPDANRTLSLLTHHLTFLQ